MESVTVVLIFCSLVAAASGGSRIVDFAEHPVSQEVAVNDAVTLQCSISTPGAAVTHWVFNGDELSSGSGIDISGNSLTISSFQTSHAGEYRCAAGTTDGFFQLSHAATLTHFGQRSFITHPEDFTVYLTPITGESTQPSRETAALQCEIERAFNGNLPVITWELRTGGEGSAITSLVQEYDEDTSRATFQYDHIGYFQLFFPIEASNGTEVRCVATGPGGLNVRSNWATIIISDQQTPSDTPVFSLQAPEQVHFIGDQDLILGCSKTSANDSFGIRWFRNFQSPFYTQGFTPVFFLPAGITLHGPTNVVLNVSMREQFEGDTFSCQVRTNDFEPATRNTTITVPPDPVPPVVYTDISSGNVSLRHTFSTTITLPTPYSGAIQWFFNGVAVSTSGSKYSVDSSDGSLTVSDITMDDEGIYQAELLDPSPPQFVNFLGIIDLGECTNTPTICGVNAICTLTEAGFICTCVPGYTGEPPTTACQDIDECEEDDDNNCHENAECTNVAGSFNCTCEEDYTGNGFSCILSDDDSGLEGWEIALIVIFLILALLCCYFLFCFLCLCWRKRWRNYYAEEKEKKYQEFRVQMDDGSYEEKKTIV